MTDSSHAVPAAAGLIEQYLERHPHAADTAKGIAAWWLAGIPEAIVQAALNDLVRRGTVKREEVMGGAPQYSRAGRH